MKYQADEIQKMPAMMDITVESGRQSLVAFDSVHVRYFERALDTNPSVSSGPALGFGWKYEDGDKLPVSEWQSNREGEKRRSSKDLVIPRHEREDMLADLGYTQQDIAKATRSIIKSKNQRRQTIVNLKYESLEEKIEKTTRAVRSILRFGTKKGIIKKELYPEHVLNE
mmetsp:Transcript_25945/g.48353  ORF Transcript_25945/g.48353 Transcript_25945/m.48353 type:complete len:169 (-) Transcript_25945:103-609(-)